MTERQILTSQVELFGKPSVLEGGGNRFDAVLNSIIEYHEELGRPKKRQQVLTQEEKLEHHRLNLLALVAEAMETLDVAPWKPWKNYKDEEVSRAHMAEELADMIFFITALTEVWDISPAQLEQAIINKLGENKRRIQSGYSKVTK